MKFIYSKITYTFIALLVVIVGLMILQTKGWLGSIEYVLLQAPSPVVKSINWLVRPIITTADTLTSLPSIVRENRQLQDELSAAKQKIVDFDQLQKDKDLLQQELNYKSKSPYQLVSCGVLAFDTQNFSDTITLNCGFEQGLEAGQAVMAGGYLIAQIVHVGNSTSTALLLTNAQSSVDAKLSKNNTEGVVKGSFGSGMIFDLVSQSADVANGDLVVTAGINPKVPKNLLIGEIGSGLSGSNDLFKKLTIVSQVKPYQIDMVFVIKQ